MEYRRVFVPGGMFFFTVVTAGRRPIFKSPEALIVLRDAFLTVRRTRPFVIDAIVILPDHLHCIWTLPPGDDDFSTRWRLIKTWFTKHCDPALLLMPICSRLHKQEQSLWQRRYWEHQLRDELDFANHVDYIHFNPVKHGLTSAAKDWPHSSFHRYVAAGILPPDWGANVCDIPGVGFE